MTKKSVKDVNVSGKLVFLRNDFNVPLKNGKISDDTRITEALPTIEYLISEKARIICASHLGRPKGEPLGEFSLQPVADRLAALLKTKVHFSNQVIGAEVDKIKKELQPGEILLLENLRFHPGETKNSPEFAAELARDIDIYVDDAFGAVHRAHASIEAITHFVPIAVAGLLLEKEIHYLSLATDNPSHPYLLILGGAKVSDKIPLIQNLLDKVDTILIGGAMAYTFLKAQNKMVGKSLVEEDQISVCREILQQAKNSGKKILLPVDHITATGIEPNITIRMTKTDEEIDPEMMGLDIGMETINLFKEEIARAALIVWNGPMGVFEVDNFAAGTFEIAHAVATGKATSIIGGGDSVTAIKKTGLSARITHISTGGGASLEFLSGLKLPGIEALNNK